MGPLNQRHPLQPRPRRVSHRRPTYRAEAIGGLAWIGAEAGGLGATRLKMAVPI